jgi:hypothetical protein
MFESRSCLIPPVFIFPSRRVSRTDSNRRPTFQTRHFPRFSSLPPLLSIAHSAYSSAPLVLSTSSYTFILLCLYLLSGL